MINYLVSLMKPMALLEGSGSGSTADIITGVGSFLTSALGWLTQVLGWMIGEPVIIFFIAIGLAGVMFRWARKLVHF